ncbi:MAG: tyrosine-protein phosphatase [Lachnoclostridium sp.]|nr:tyrosine-protein phosphatase [Lachnoclostridium sp.]
MNQKNRVISLDGALNARDLGGLPLKDGRYVKKGKLIRSGRLSDLTEQDKNILVHDWNVTTIVDLRNDQEISEHPDVTLDGVSLKNICLLSGEKKAISREDYGLSMSLFAINRAKSLLEDGGSKKLLEGMYGQMAENEECIDRIRDFFELLLLQEDGSLIWHCTSGKDRTGVLGVLLLLLLGADLEVAKEDYLYTNEQNHTYRENLLERMRKRGAEENVIEEMRILESVDWIYIESFLNTLVNRYGSIDLFLTNVIGMDAECRRKLLEIYTEKE